MKKSLVMSFLLIVFFMLNPGNSSYATELSIVPSVANVKHKTSFTTEILVHDVVNCIGFEITLLFNNELICVKNIEIGNFFSDSFLVVQNILDCERGQIEYSALQFSKNNIGTGNLMTITWETMSKSGDAFISFNTYQLFDYGAEMINVSQAHNATINITPINTPPIAYGNEIFTHDDKHIYISLGATDFDNDELTYHILSLPTHGKVSLTGNAALYTPNTDYNGTDSFTFKVNDGNTDSNTAAITITVYPVGGILQAISQDVKITEDMPINITLTGYSPDSKPLTFQIIHQPVHGILSESSPYLTYTPDHHFFGTDCFKFIANDSISDSLSETISITVERSKTYELKLLGNVNATAFINSTSVLLPWNKQFQADQEVCIEVIPDSDWQFVQWQGDLQSSENPVCVILDQNKTITANMEIKTFVLSIQGSEPITINNALHILPFSKEFEIHTPITLESDSEFFRRWEGDINRYQRFYTFTINSDMAITAIFYPVTDWKTTIHLKRASEYCAFRDQSSVTIGTATHAYKIDAMPALPCLCCYMYLFDHIYDNAFPKIREDIRQSNILKHEWHIAALPRGENPHKNASISWDPLSFDPEGQYILKHYTGEILVSDMRKISEYELTHVYSYNYFTIVWQKSGTYSIHLQQGWNLISLPLTPSNTAISHLFPDYEAAYEYKNGAYHSVTHIKPGLGYWLKIPSEKTYAISGQPFLSYAVDLAEGWHIIGQSYNEIPTDNIYNTPIFRYVNGRYEQAFKLMPGFGYWWKLGSDQAKQFKLKEKHPF